jgi:ABC-type uncharacterized transport system permease subunit
MFKQKWTKLVLGLIVVLLLAGGIYKLTLRDNKTNTSIAPTAVTSTATTSTDITFQGVTGKSALQILEANHKVDVKMFSGSPYVQGIDGLEGDKAHYWSFYVNGTPASVGAGDYVSKNTDKIEFKYVKM